MGGSTRNTKRHTHGFRRHRKLYDSLCQTPIGTYMPFDNHDYADDIIITTRTLENLQTQIQNLHLFLKYTRLEPETTKCEATWALWGYRNPPSMANTNLLRSQTNNIKFDDGTNIKYIPPDK